MTDGTDNSITAWRHLRRVMHITGVLVKHAWAHSCHPQLARLSGISKLPGPQRLRSAIEEMGGSFIKLGQMMAFQPDVIGREYCNALAGLLDQVPAFSFDHVEQTMLEDLGKKPLEVFDAFNQHPFATGSIGQVHLAMLNNRSVAVKVRRPTVEADFFVDLNLIRILIKLIKISHIRKFYWLVEPLSEFVSWTSEELDYRHEASYIEQLGINARENPHEHVPAVLWDYTTNRVLVVEYLEAPTVLDYMRKRNVEAAANLSLPAEFAPNLFARNIIHNFIGDALRHGVFHADLHAANLMIMPQSEVGYIDFGIVGMLTPYSRYYLIAMTLAYTRGNLEEISTSFFKLSTVTNDSNIERFKTELKILADQWYDAPAQGQRLRKSITLVMLDLLNLSKATNIWPRREVIRYIRSAIVLDGLVKNFAPSLDLGQELEHICNQHYLWYDLQDLILSEERMSTCLLFVTDTDQELARQEFNNLRDAVQHFGFIDRTANGNSEASDRPLLNGRIQAVAQMERFESLWATEGLGFLVGEVALKAKQCPLHLLSCHKTSALPVSSRAAIHVGISLSVGKRLLAAVREPDSRNSLSNAVRKFVAICEERSPAGCGGIAVEALGLVVRTLHPQWLTDVDRELEEIDSNLIGYFWHGVGRGLYFLFPPVLYSQGTHSIAVEKAWQDPPHETGRFNALAGLAWPLTLVNIRHPKILAEFLKRYSAQIPGNGAFSSGIATSILLWLAWAGNDKYLAAFMDYQPECIAFSDVATWSKFVREPCLEVMEYHHRALNKTRRYGELFCYQPLDHLRTTLNGTSRQ